MTSGVIIGALATLVLIMVVINARLSRRWREDPARVADARKRIESEVTARFARQAESESERLAGEREQERIELGQERARIVAERAQERQERDQERQQLAQERARSASERDQERLRLSEERARIAVERAEIAAEAARRQDNVARAQAREEAITARDGALRAREDSLERKLTTLDQRDTRMREREEALEARARASDAREHGLAEREAEAQAKLQAISALTTEQARDEIFAKLERTLAAELGERIARHEREVASRGKELAIEVVSRAIQRYAAEHTAETTTAKVRLADEELKGRIIGKEGRNIKAFEQATGVDIILDEGQPVITVSCFDPVRREIARRTLELLLDDGRIHPARIEEVLARVTQDLDRELVRLGEEAAFAVEVSGLHPQLIKLLGKLHFRTSYGQNVLKHTQEVAFLCGAMAADLGLDPRMGRRCGLLHDIGKAIDHEQEGSHPQLGYEALKRYGESEVVANAALAHHEGHQVLSAYTVLAAAADAISAARPGARSESSERYLKRLQQLEDIACAFHGVHKAYAIQAGREIRVIINGHTLGDHELAKVAHDIARKIENEVQYPGEVKVTLIREVRQIAVAR